MPLLVTLVALDLKTGRVGPREARCLEVLCTVSTTTEDDSFVVPFSATSFPEQETRKGLPTM